MKTYPLLKQAKSLLVLGEASNIGLVIWQRQCLWFSLFWLYSSVWKILPWMFFPYNRFINPIPVTHVAHIDNDCSLYKQIYLSNKTWCDKHALLVICICIILSHANNIYMYKLSVLSLLLGNSLLQLRVRGWSKSFNGQL